jgi:processive 1,2-diacylglycerol beta-glucosyltransferase
VPQAVVLTDFAAHPQWIYPEVDRYFAPSEPIREELIARGVPAERVVTSGIPIDRAFRPPPDRGALRAALGLAADIPTPLIMGGMQGRVGGLAEACEVLRGVTLPFQALVVCGSYHDLADRLRGRLAGDDRFRIFGRVTDIHRLMGAADFVVTKAGASTCAEALALERPLLFYRSLPGQEQANERAIEQAGAGLRAADAAALRRHLEALLQDPRRRSALATATERLRRPDAGDAVAKELLALTGAPA